MERAPRRFVASAEGLEGRALLSVAGVGRLRAAAEIRAMPRGPRGQINEVFAEFRASYTENSKRFYDAALQKGSMTAEIRDPYLLYTRQVVDQLAGELNRRLLRFQPTGKKDSQAESYASGVNYLAVRNINGRAPDQPLTYARNTLGRGLIDGIPPLNAPASTFGLYWTTQLTAIDAARLGYQNGVNGLRASLAKNTH